MKNINGDLERLEIERVKEYISKELRDGFSLNDIKKALVKAGHPPEDIDRAIQEIKSSQSLDSKRYQENAPKNAIKPQGKIEEKNFQEIPAKNPSFSEIKSIHLIFNKKIAAILIIGIIMIIAGFFIWNHLPKAEIKDMGTETKDSNIQLLVKAAEKNDVSYCGQITDHNMYYDCYDKVWLQKDNCRFQELTGLNLEECYTALAIKQKDIFVCSKITNNVIKETCYMKTYEQLDPDTCEKDYSCLKYLFDKNKDSSICNKMRQQTIKDDCYYTYASQFNNISSCSSIAQQDKKDDCFNVFALRLKNLTYCDQIKDKNTKEQCIFKTSSFAESIKLIPQDDFYNLLTKNYGSNERYIIGDKIKDINDCPSFKLDVNVINEMLSSPSFNIGSFVNSEDRPYLSVDLCYLFSSFQNNNLSDCGNITSHNIKKLCYSYFTKECESANYNEKEYALCNSILKNCSAHNEMDTFCKELGANNAVINGNFYKSRGSYFYSQKEFENAIQQFKAAAKINPKDSENYMLIGWSYYYLKENSNSTTFFKKALEVNANNYESYVGLGWNYYQSNNYEEASVYFKKAIEVNASYYDSYVGLGWSYYKLRNYNEAIKYFKQALELNSNISKAYLGLGWSYYYLKNNDETFVQFNKLNELNPNSLDTYDSLGMEYLIKKEFSAALEYFNKALELNSKNLNVNCHLALYYYDTGDYNSAKEYIDTCIRLDSNNNNLENTDLRQKIYEKISRV